MDFSSINFDTCWKSFGSFPTSRVIYKWRCISHNLSVPCWNTLPRVKKWKVYKHSLKCKNIEVEFTSSSWGILRNSRSQIDDLAVLKIFENFTRKHLCWSLFLVNFNKNRLQTQVLSSEIWEIFMNTFL